MFASVQILLFEISKVLFKMSENEFYTPHGSLVSDWIKDQCKNDIKKSIYSDCVGIAEPLCKIWCLKYEIEASENQALRLKSKSWCSHKPLLISFFFKQASFFFCDLYVSLLVLILYFMAPGSKSEKRGKVGFTGKGNVYIAHDSNTVQSFHLSINGKAWSRFPGRVSLLAAVRKLFVHRRLVQTV